MCVCVSMEAEDKFQACLLQGMKPQGKGCCSWTRARAPALGWLHSPPPETGSKGECVSVCMHVHTHTYTYICSHSSTHACTYTLHIPACTHTCTSTHLPTHAIHIRRHIYIFRCAFAYNHTIHLHTHAHFTQSHPHTSTLSDIPT